MPPWPSGRSMRYLPPARAWTLIASVSFAAVVVVLAVVLLLVPFPVVLLLRRRRGRRWWWRRRGTVELVDEPVRPRLQRLLQLARNPVGVDRGDHGRLQAASERERRARVAAAGRSRDS